MAKRVKRTIVSGVTREQADAAFSRFAAADAKEQRLTESMEEQIARIREQYEPQIQECTEEKEKAFEVMQIYAMENKDQLFTRKRSVETPYGTFGFRTGTPKLKIRNGFTWPGVTQLLKVYLPDFVRVTEEPAKDSLLAAREDENVARFFPEVGIYVDQDENFFVERRK